MKRLFVITLLVLSLIVTNVYAYTVFISGVESGVCVVPNVNLWNKPYGHVTSSINGCSGMPVKVIETKHSNGRTWYHVKTFGTNAGKSGWVLDTFVK